MAEAVAVDGEAGAGTMEEMAARADHSWLQQLLPDPEAARHAPNKKSREVRSGHWVPVLPTPLPQPKLIIASAEAGRLLGLSDSELNSERFLRVRLHLMTCAPEL